MVARVFSSLFAAIVVFALLTGNCLNCPMLEPAAIDAHDCCPHKEKQKPSSDKKECPSELYFAQGFEKASSQSLATVDLAAELPAYAPAVPALPDAPSIQPESKPHAPPDLYLVNSVLLI
jgi:hypothetical protein